jgi:hypothetical protein
MSTKIASAPAIIHVTMDVIPPCRTVCLLEEIRHPAMTPTIPVALIVIRRVLCVVIKPR